MTEEIKNPIVEEMVKLGMINTEQGVTLELEMQRSQASVASAARSLAITDENVLLDFLSEKMHIDRMNITNIEIDEEIIKAVSSDSVFKYNVIPLEKNGSILKVGILDPFNMDSLVQLRADTGLFIKPYLVSKDEFDSFVMLHYADAVKRPILKKENFSDEGKPSIIKFVNLLLAQAVNTHASDVHIEPKKEDVQVRLRIDGVLQEFQAPPKSMYNAIVARIKIMAGLDIAERRIPQDGRIQAKIGVKLVDVRVSVIPLVEGESIVLRILERDKGIISLPAIGFSEDLLSRYLKFLKQTQGIVLVTGPTGSGKSTTLYASLSEIQGVDKNIITIEDPVEYHLGFAKQIQVNTQVGLTFAGGLRAVLRHDPDIIMVGEIRDMETAEIATQAALTGHLVLSTLHTNDASSAITRLVDMGIEPFLVASSIRGVIAQRLARVLCRKCRRKVQVRENDVRIKLGLEPNRKETVVEIYESRGCQDCVNTGYRGRSALFEVLEIDSAYDNMIVEKASASDLQAYAKTKGFTTLKEDGLSKILSGLTSIDEVLRVLGA